MRRTQLYLDEDLWAAVRNQAKRSGTTVSELVRQALRSQFLNKLPRREESMLAAVGMWRDREDMGDSDEYVRMLRRGSRVDRLDSEWQS